MGAIRNTPSRNKYSMDLHLPDPTDASGTKLAHLVVEQGSRLNASKPSSSSSNATSSASAITTPSRAASARNRRFVCSYPDCDKTFTTSGHLARHLRVHTGEKAFQCTFPNCESRFSRHDNMLQHYRNHIVRNARRRKKAFASAVATGTVGITGNVPYDDDLKAILGGRAQAPPPKFIHSAYTVLSRQNAAPSISHWEAYHPHNQQNQQYSDSVQSGDPLHTSTSPGSARGSSISPVLAPQHYTPSASSRPTHLNLSPFNSREAAYAGSLVATPSTMYTHLSPPLASPSVMDRPHTATTSFFPLNLDGAAMSIQPPPLTHRHSYSALGNQPVLEPITPTSELPHYPLHQYPSSPAPLDPRELYSPTLTASPHPVAGFGTPSSEGTYFQPFHGSATSLYPDQCGPPHVQAGTSASYPPTRSHPHSSYPLHPPATATTGATPRSAVFHSLLGQSNPLLSGLDGGNDSALSSSSRSTSIASTSAQYLALSSDNLAPDSTQYTPQLSTSAPPARWLSSPAAYLEQTQYPHMQTFAQSHAEGHGWQPDRRENYTTTSAEQIVSHDVSTMETRSYTGQMLEEQGYGYSDQQTWAPYESGM